MISCCWDTAVVQGFALVVIILFILSRLSLMFVRLERRGSGCYCGRIYCWIVNVHVFVVVVVFVGDFLVTKPTCSPSKSEKWTLQSGFGLIWSTYIIYISYIYLLNSCQNLLYFLLFPVNEKNKGNFPAVFLKIEAFLIILLRRSWWTRQYFTESENRNWRGISQWRKAPPEWNKNKGILFAEKDQILPSLHWTSNVWDLFKCWDCRSVKV